MSMERKERKMSCSATNHGFTIPTGFCEKAHIKKGDEWEWIPCPKSGMLILFPVDQNAGANNTKNVVSVQEMRLKRRKKTDRVQMKLNISIDLIRVHRLNTAKCKVEWVLIGENLHGEIFLQGTNVR